MEEKESSDKKRRRSVTEVFDKERERAEKRMSFHNVDGAFEGKNAMAVQKYLKRHAATVDGSARLATIFNVWTGKTPATLIGGARLVHMQPAPK
jgi:hypothetical protein